MKFAEPKASDGMVARISPQDRARLKRKDWRFEGGDGWGRKGRCWLGRGSTTVPHYQLPSPFDDSSRADSSQASPSTPHLRLAALRHRLVPVSVSPSSQPLFAY